MDNIIDFTKAKQRKELESDLARGRQPLIISHGKVSAYGELYRSPIGGIPSVRDSLKRIDESFKEMKRLADSINILPEA
jgi:hypothetical protein